VSHPDSNPVGAQLRAEGIGTFILVFIGNAAVAISVMTLAFDLLGLALLWGVAVALGIYAAGAVSGGHLNPAVTVAMAVYRGFPKNRILPFVMAQLAGAALAAVAVQATFGPLVRSFELRRSITRGNPGSEISAMIHSTFGPNPVMTEMMPNFGQLNWFGVELLATALFVLMIMVVTDPNNRGRPLGNLAPLLIGATLAALVAVTAPLTMTAVNPARDLGPRIVAYFAGWGSVVIPGTGNGFWIPTVAPLVGALVGGAIYVALLGRTYRKDEPTDTPEPSPYSNVIKAVNAGLPEGD
jgi:glycerol uptake facilitator protein